MHTTIYFASDHAGFELKDRLIDYVRDELGYEVVDCGAYAYDKEDDFTDFIAKAAREVSAQPSQNKAIILGGSGQGEAMMANRFHDVRAAVYYGGDEEIVKLSREHNDANVLSLGARFLDIRTAKKAVDIWLATPHVSVEKYDRRIEELETLSTTERNTSLSLAPSLPPSSFEELSALLDALAGTAQTVQVDIVDGVFVPARSWPFTVTNAEAELGKLQQYTKQFALEVDCMCVHPERFLDLCSAMGVQRMVIHYGSTDDLAACIAHARSHRYQMGIALTNATPLTELADIIPQMDFVQVMGIEHIGMQGQPFDERTIATISELRSKYPALEIAVDGAVNEATITRLRDAGANRFAPGSAISRSGDPVASYKQLASLVGLL